MNADYLGFMDCRDKFAELGRKTGRMHIAGFVFRVLGFRFRILCFGFRVSDFGFRVSSFRFLAAGLGSRISGFRIPVSIFWDRVSGLNRAAPIHRGPILIRPPQDPPARFGGGDDFEV